MRYFLTAVLFLAPATSSFGQYNVEIEVDSTVIAGNNVTLSVSLVPAGTNYELGGFNLEFSYDPSRLFFPSVAQGSFLTSCGWEFFTYQVGGPYYSGCCVLCPDVSTIRINAIADQSNGTTPSCFSASDTVEIVKLTFLTGVNEQQLTERFSPIDFYWRLDVDPCTKNNFSSRDGNSLYGAETVYTVADTAYDSAFNCSGPPESCTGLLSEFDFYGGGMNIIYDTSDRGDLNLDALKFIISDAVLYANYFIFGSSVFNPNPAIQARQIAASETNCDDVPLTVADLVFMIRVITGDAFPGPGCYALPVKKNTPNLHVSSVIGDTLLFPNASGNPGQKRVPFYVKVANGQPLGGLQARITYNPAYLTPHLDSVIGDGQSVEYTLLGRAVGFESQGIVKVQSPSAGVIIIKFFPHMDGVDFPIATGSGNILKFNMDVVASPPSPATTPVQFVTLGFDYNLFADVYGNTAIQPTTVNGTFTVTYPPPPPPSCPVLFTLTEADYIKEDVLLTACEQSNYRDIVTDYYHVQNIPLNTGNRVSFQIKEMEDEITYLSNLQLLTIDHSSNTKVACDVNGNVFSYKDNIAAPLTAVDNNGYNRLPELAEIDGIPFVSNESGFLVLTFENSLKNSGIEINAAKKQQCPDPADKKTVQEVEQDRSTMKVEVLDQTGEWIEFSTVPSRENSSKEIVMLPVQSTLNSETITVRMSWTGRYATDAVRQLAPADEKPQIAAVPISGFKLNSSDAANKWTGLSEETPLLLRKGDSFEFSFDTNEPIGPGTKRDFVIVATGKYEPDYAIYDNLLPNTVALFNNYPNPFNPTTVISYSLPKADKVKLEIFNILGQSIKVLVDGHQEAGLHRVEWNSEANGSLASGIYLYKLTAGEFAETKKMMLVK